MAEPHLLERDANWHSVDYELKYRLGELTLAKQRLKVLRKTHDLAAIMVHATDSTLPPLSAGHDGYLLADVPESCLGGSIQRQGEWLRYCLKSYQRCFIDMSGSFDDYQAGFSAKTRSGIKRKLRKFVEHAGALDFRSYRTASEMDEFFALARPVSAASYQERLLDCGLPADPRFIEEARADAGRGSVRAFVLCAHGQAVSYLYCPVNDGVLEYAYLGYTPHTAKLSAGTVLQWLALQSLFEERGFKAFDFTEGESEHKRLFSTGQVTCSVQLLLRPTVYGRISAFVHRGVDAASGWVGARLERHGWKSRIRQWLRTTA